MKHSKSKKKGFVSTLLATPLVFPLLVAETFFGGGARYPGDALSCAVARLSMNVVLVIHIIRA